MTTDDLRTRARAEAEKRWPWVEAESPGEWHDLGMASGFVLGALWHAAQQPTREQIARAAAGDLYGRDAEALLAKRPGETYRDHAERVGKWVAAVVAHLTKGDENDE